VPLDSVWCTMTVQMSSSHTWEFQGTLRYKSPVVRCATGLSGEPAGNSYPAPMLECKVPATVNSASGPGLSSVAPDCLVPQEDKASNGRPAPNPNGWVSWRRTGTVPVWWRTRLSSAPIASSLPNGYGSGWGL
jgi:hypothetical protein